MSDKIDLRKTYKALFAATAEPSLVEVPELAVFAVDGSGDPNDEEVFSSRMEALYTASFTLKFTFKKERGIDWTVLSPEGDWWCLDMATFSLARKAEWLWRLMIVQPDFITEAEALEAIKETRAKKRGNPALDSLRFERRPAHRAAHILHIGPYAAEQATIERLHAFIAAQGLCMVGEHREIYIGDPRKADPAKLKTIIRQPLAE